jgi:hypothetical protein
MLKIHKKENSGRMRGIVSEGGVKKQLEASSR